MYLLFWNFYFIYNFNIELIMYKVAILNKNGDIYSQNFKTKEEADNFVLKEAEKGIKKAIISNIIYPQEREVINFEE